MEETSASLTEIAEEDQADYPGWVSRSSPALGGPIIADSQSTNVSVECLLIAMMASTTLFYREQIHESPVLSFAPEV